MNKLNKSPNPQENIPASLLDYTCNIRHDLHKNPELSLNEFHTTQRVESELKKMGLEVLPRLGPTGVVALWPGMDRNRSVALRADMDALPMQEKSGKAWTSQNPGIMHACGHDGHTAILLGVAKALTLTQKKYPCDITLVFQPAEESGHGAKHMLDCGWLSHPKPEAIFALHGWPSLPQGTACVHAGPMMASVDNFEILITGRGGHGAQPQFTLDPIVLAAQLVTLSQSLISRGLDPAETAVLTFGQIEGGTTFNVIPDTCMLRGTLRTHANEIRLDLKEKITALCNHMGQSFGQEVKLIWVEACPATVNNALMAEIVRRAIYSELGNAGFYLEKPSMAGEDFSVFLESIPGAYFWLGLGLEQGSLHNARFDFNDAALETGMRLFLAVLVEYFAGFPQEAI